MKIEEKIARVLKHVTKTHFWLPYVLSAQKTRARTRTRVKIKNAQNGLIRALVWSKSDFEHFLILTRAYAHVMTRVRQVMSLGVDP